MTSPSKVALGSTISRITDIIVTLLPEPDSPTMPSVSPSATVKDTPSTALTTPSSVRKLTLRLRTSSSGSAITTPPSGRPHSRIERGIRDVHQGVRHHDEERPVDHCRHDRRQ